MKTCIFLISFGTSTIEGYENSFRPLLEGIKNKIGLDSFIGFTSERLIKKLKDERIISIEDKLNEIKNRGYEKIIVIKLILSNGKENIKIDKILEEKKDSFKEIIKTTPILAYKNEFIDKCLAKNEMTVLISHGREDGLIDYIDDEFKIVLSKEYKNLKYLSLNKKEESTAIIKELIDEKIKKVIFKPLLLTSGYHFKKDIYSLEENSFKKIFSDYNIEVEETNYGLLYDKNFIEFLMEKLSIYK